MERREARRRIADPDVATAGTVARATHRGRLRSLRCGLLGSDPTPSSTLVETASGHRRFGWITAPADSAGGSESTDASRPGAGPHGVRDSGRRYVAADGFRRSTAPT